MYSALVMYSGPVIYLGLGPVIYSDLALYLVPVCQSVLRSVEPLPKLLPVFSNIFRPDFVHIQSLYMSNPPIYRQGSLLFPQPATLSPLGRLQCSNL